jgi:hypothetical protein
MISIINAKWLMASKSFDCRFEKNLRWEPINARNERKEEGEEKRKKRKKNRRRGRAPTRTGKESKNRKTVKMHKMSNNKMDAIMTRMEWKRAIGMRT